jgi:hypothetical protein
MPCLPAEAIAQAAPAGRGDFRGRVVAEWLRGGREMKLIEPFQYIAPDRQVWPVPAGTVVDGASIPRVFWSIIGGPFEGLYREPSVVHDYYCDVRTRPFEDVHRVFFDAMLASGVGESRAWLMYKAVVNFGPYWQKPNVLPQCEIVDENYDFDLCAHNSATPDSRLPPATKSDLAAFAREVEAKADARDLAALRAAIEKM